MGICDSLFNNSSNPSNTNGKEEGNQYRKLPINNNHQSSQNKQRGNYFRSSIGESNDFNNMNMSQSMTTVGNNSFYPPQKIKPFTYVNTYKQNGNLQKSLATGSLHGTNNNYSSIMTGNKSDSKISDNNMSTSKSFGEFIVEGEINKNMEGDKDFNNFMDMNVDDIIDNDINLDGDIKNNINKNKKDVNYYHKKNPKNIYNNNLKIIKERNKEEESSENQQPPIPLDTIE